MNKLKKEENTSLKQLKKPPFIEIFRIQNLDNSIFDNYQRYDFYQLMWFTEVGGNLSYFLDFNEYTIEKNQVILIFPGQIDMMDTRGKEGYLFAIDNETFFRMNQRIGSDYLNGYLSNAFISLNDEIKTILEKLIELLLLEYNANNRIGLLESYMEAFLFQISSFFENTDIDKKNYDSVISELMKLIDRNFIYQKETDFYADKFSMSNKTINEICKKGTGKTVKQHLQERLILEIKKEIRLNEKSFKEIAFNLGFNEAAYFTRFFKKHTALSPKDFRNKTEK